MAGVTGINHITLAVADLERSLSFYVEVLGFGLAACWTTGAYLVAGDLWLALLVDADRIAHSSADYSHLAFSVRAEDFQEIDERIRENGAIIWQENTSEGDSLYFLDPDSYKLEIHASDLAARLEAMARDPKDPTTLIYESEH